MGSLSGMTKPFTVEEINEALFKLDVLEKPYIVVCKSDMEKNLKAAVGDKITVKGHPYMEDDKVLLVMKDSDLGRMLMETV